MHAADPCPDGGVAPAGVPPPPRTARGAALAFAVSHVAFAALLWASAARLPARVATHFGIGGAANGWMSRTGYLLFLGALPLGLAGILWFTAGLARRLPPRFVNLPRRDYWLAPARRDEAVVRLRRHLLGFACIQTAFFAALHALTVRANGIDPPRLDEEALLTVVLAFMAALALWVANLLVRFARPEGNGRDTTNLRGVRTAGRVRHTPRRGREERP